MTSSIPALNKERTKTKAAYFAAAYGWCDSPSPVQLIRSLNAFKWNWYRVGNRYRAILDKSTGEVLMFVYFDLETKSVRPVRREDLP